jgi:outer membrane receptor for ferric coprogen and ferric-rhodotorulic acid
LATSTGFRVTIFRLSLISLAFFGAAAAYSAESLNAAAAVDTTLEQVVVTGAVDPVASSATGLALTLKETPQSVTVVQRDLIQTLSLTNVNDLLDQVPGINVERNETDRTMYDARGFDITNFQIDSIGLPMIEGLQYGALDTALWDRVEVIRGANGMMTGVGNPSATVNYVRKRPTADFEASLTGEVGSWDQKRLEADVSGPINADGTIQARLIFAHDDHQSYLDYYEVHRNVLGALLSWDITPQLKATVGYSRQQNNADGVLWGALPLSYSDGTQIENYPVSASTAASWTFWDIQDQTAFSELAYQFDGGWSGKGIVTYRKYDTSSRLLYAYGYPNPATGLGVEGYSGEYPDKYRQYLIDLYASGPYELFGRQHDLAIGFSGGRSDGQEEEAHSDDEIDYPSYRQWGQVEIPEPSYFAYALQVKTRDQLFRMYAATHLNFTDTLKGVLGFSAAKLQTTGYSYGVDEARLNTKASPYVGLLYDLTNNATLYGSYTSIFNPQSEVDAGGQRLAPAVGYSYETGLKTEWFDKRLYATIAGFRSKQNHLATFAGVFGADATVGPPGGSYYSGVDTTSTGFEIEFSGHITDRWKINGGYSYFTLADDAGADPRPYIPHRSLKVSTTYVMVPAYDLHVGADVRWQDSIYYVDSGVTTADGSYGSIRQPDYATVGLLANARITDHLHAYFNLNNVAARKYLASLEWGQAYYAAPRNATLSVVYTF